MIPGRIRCLSKPLFFFIDQLIAKLLNAVLCDGSYPVLRYHRFIEPDHDPTALHINGLHTIHVPDKPAERERALLAKLVLHIQGYLFHGNLPSYLQISSCLHTPSSAADTLGSVNRKG